MRRCVRGLVVDRLATRSTDNIRHLMADLPKTIVTRLMVSATYFSIYHHWRLTTSAGLTFCALATLSFLGHPGVHDPLSSRRQGTAEVPQARHWDFDHDRMIKWLAHRFTIDITDEDYEHADDATRNAAVSEPDAATSEQTEKSFQKIRSVPASEMVSTKDQAAADAFVEMRSRPICWAGFAGRCNKIADTCYAFWAGASLKVCSCKICPFW